MKFGELTEMSSEQLEAVLREAKDTLFRLRIRAQTERLDAPSEMRKNRRLIARVKTLQTQRQRGRETTNSGRQPAETSHA
jgi:large subunit ribosomal protein L29